MNAIKKILIVEDDDHVSLALCVRLKANGYSTWVASDAIGGMSMALRHRPNLILLDVSLPAGNGFDLAEQLSRLPETRETPIILITASHDPALREKAIGLGAAGLLRKPFEAEELLGAIHEALECTGQVDLLVSDGISTSRHVSRRNHTPRVLIVEDDENVARGLAIRMAAAGFDTTVANDAVSGVRDAMNTRPDVVILDISLPAGDGFAVAERLQAHLPSPTRIIFLTASARPDLRRRARELGAVAFFEKPYEAEALLKTIHENLVN